jgi:hypothetical protein
MLLDVELLQPGDDEVAAALRLIKRVLENHPRCFDVLTGDALYLRPSVINLLDGHGKHLIAVLKENQPELLSEARTLLPKQEQDPQQFDTEAAPGKPSRHIVLRQADGFRTENIEKGLRVVHSHETGIRRERIAGEWVETPIDSHWYWGTTMPSSLTDASVIHRIGHARWHIENDGFNELATFWNSRHCYHHHHNSILVLWLIMFMAHAVFQCFYKRNLKAAARKGHTAIFFAKQITASFYLLNWWPASAAPG